MASRTIQKNPKTKASAQQFVRKWEELKRVMDKKIGSSDKVDLATVMSAQEDLLNFLDNVSIQTPIVRLQVTEVPDVEHGPHGGPRTAYYAFDPELVKTTKIGGETVMDQLERDRNWCTRLTMKERTRIANWAKKNGKKSRIPKRCYTIDPYTLDAVEDCRIQYEV